jgi:hypothetical protein
MHFMPEDLARAHMAERVREAENYRQIARLKAARKVRRKAERAAQRACRVLTTPAR